MFADGVPVFPNSAGINSDELALQMVEVMDKHSAVFLKGHGIVVLEQTTRVQRFPRSGSKERRATKSCSHRSVNPNL
jgi:hypothetical protein